MHVCLWALRLNLMGFIEKVDMTLIQIFRIMLFLLIGEGVDRDGLVVGLGYFIDV
jgi:hypothetical protein